MKGSISEFELGVLRARMLDAARAKRAAASCASACRSATSGIARSVSASIPTWIQEAVRLIFARFRELGSARQCCCR